MWIKTGVPWLTREKERTTRRSSYPGLAVGPATSNNRLQQNRPTLPLATATSGRNSRLLRYDQSRAAQEGVVLRHIRVPQTRAAAGRDQPVGGISPHIRGARVRRRMEHLRPDTASGPGAVEFQWSRGRFEQFLSDLQTTRNERMAVPQALEAQKNEKKKRAALFLVTGSRVSCPLWRSPTPPHPPGTCTQTFANPREDPFSQPPISGRKPPNTEGCSANSLS